MKAHYDSKISELEKERATLLADKHEEVERLNNQNKILNQKLTQMQRLLEKQMGTKPSTSSRPPEKSSMEPPTANIKPMAGSSSSPRKEKQTTVGLRSLYDIRKVWWYVVIYQAWKPRQKLNGA